MNRQLWDSFLRQVDAQVEGDFISLAAEYEAVSGHPFKVDSNQDVLFSMLEQAMMTQHSGLLKSTLNFINDLPPEMQKEFRHFGRSRILAANRSNTGEFGLKQAY